MSRHLFDWIGALLLVGGAAVFLWGGAQHPRTDASMGAVGTAEYFRAFAEHVAAAEGWRVIHAAILAGPLLWALGILGLARRSAVGPGSGWCHLGTHALGLGAMAWAVVFVLDGFVAPIHATAVLETGTPDAIMAFRTNQEIVIRLGLVSWMLIGVGIAGSAVAAWLSSDRSVRSDLFGGLGLTVGLWPVVAWLTGEFVPGPFTSGYWTATAILTSLWVAWAGVRLTMTAPQYEAGQVVDHILATSDARH